MNVSDKCGGRLVSCAKLLLLIAGVASACTAARAQDDPPRSDSEPAAQEEDAAFDVWEYRVVGASVLEPRVVETTLYPLLGPGKRIQDVEAARQALETAYRNAGYSTVFVDIPEQTVDDGVVRLSVTEGRLDRVRVSGARYFSNRRILAKLPALERGEVPHFPEIQEQLAALNRLTPDRAVTPVLRAGRSAGTVDVELRVQDDLPFHGSLEVNDRYTANTSELRSSLSMSYDNLWQRAHSVSLQYQFAPEARDEAEVVALTYLARLERARTLLALYAVDSSSDVATVGTLSVLGQGRIFGVRGIRPLDSIGSYFHNVTLGVDLKDFDENVRLTEESGLTTAIKYVNWSASYAFGWTRANAVSDFSVGAAWGIRGFGNDDFEFEEKRFKGRGNYAYLTGSGHHSQPVFGDARFDARLNWQYANMPLISNEQFSAGGAASVRGYLEAEQFGDIGASLSLELHSPPLVRGSRIEDLHVFGFFDAASLWLEDPLPSQEFRQRLSSAGIGIRFVGFGGVQAGVDWARPLRDGANVMEGEDRLHFRLSYGF